MDEKLYKVDDPDQLFEACLEFFERVGHGVIAVYIYGSMIKVCRGHDLDVAVFGHEDMDEFRLGSQLEGWLLSKGIKVPVDLKIMSHAPTWAQFQAIKEGKRIYQKSPEEAADLEFWIITRYLDFKPVLEEYEREAMKIILKAISGRP